MTAIPSLYLKWGLFRSLVGSAQSDAQIAKTVFGNLDGAAILFSKLLYGDYGCTPDVATALVSVMNRRIEGNKGRQESGEGSGRVSANDLSLPVYEFAQKLIDAAGSLTSDQLDAAHQYLLSALALPTRPKEGPQLTIRRFSIDRIFGKIGEDWLPSGGEGPVVFRTGPARGPDHRRAVGRGSIATYAFLMRDPRSVGSRLGEMKWGETILWLPSP
jgi:hypothetical protein